MHGSVFKQNLKKKLFWYQGNLDLDIFREMWFREVPETRHGRNISTAQWLSGALLKAVARPPSSYSPAYSFHLRITVSSTSLQILHIGGVRNRNIPCFKGALNLTSGCRNTEEHIEQRRLMLNVSKKYFTQRSSIFMMTSSSSVFLSSFFPFLGRISEICRMP